MRNLRVCIYGGTNLQGTPTEFISTLAYKILDSMEAVIVTGGFLKSNDEPNAISTDVAALQGARRYANKHKESLKDCYEAWVPDPALDTRQDIKKLRLTEAEGITVRVMTGRTSLGRRLAMVASVDMVITIAGRVHTEVVVEQAVELGIPVLPIPVARGQSEYLLEKYKERIAAGFEAGALDNCVAELSNHWITSDFEKAAGDVVRLMRTAKVGKCLVLFPYDPDHELVYQSTIEPAIDKHMIPVRLDHLPRSEAIYTSFADAIRSCSAVIADITMLNELPVYFRTLNVRLASQETPADKLIDDYLTSLKDTRRLHQRAIN